jgi:hypothetical protein
MSNVVPRERSGLSDDDQQVLRFVGLTDARSTSAGVIVSEVKVIGLPPQLAVPWLAQRVADLLVALAAQASRTAGWNTSTSVLKATPGWHLQELCRQCLRGVPWRR